MNPITIDRASSSSSEAHPQVVSNETDDTITELSPSQIRQQAIARTLENVRLTSPALEALKVASRDMYESVCDHRRTISVLQNYSLSDLSRYPKLKALTCDGDLRPEYEKSPSDLYYTLYNSRDPLWRRISACISSLLRPLQLASFKMKQAVYEFEGGRVQDAELDNLSVLFELDRLHLKNLQFVTDRGLSEIGKLSQLKHLNLTNCPNILGEGLCQIDQLHQLESLELIGQYPARLKESGALDTLANLPALQEVQFGPLSPGQLRFLAAHEIAQKVKTADIKQCNPTIVENLAKLPNLENLTLSSFDLSYDANANEIARQIGRLTQLRTLKFLTGGYWREAVGVLLDTAVNLPNLTALDLKWLEPGVRWLEPGDDTKLRRLTTLRDLSIGNAPSRFTDELTSWPQLRTLALNFCWIWQITGWQNTSLVETLKLTSSRFLTPLGVTTLKNLPKLKSLDLNSTSLPLNFRLHHLADLKRLQDLDLSYHRLESRGEGLPIQPEWNLPVPLPNLMRLSLKGCTLTRDDFELIAQLPKLEKIDLTHAQFDEEDFENLKSQRPLLHIRRSDPELRVEKKWWRRALKAALSIAKLYLRSIKDYLLSVVTLRG